jgi:hypothetical protein
VGLSVSTPPIHATRWCVALRHGHRRGLLKREDVADAAVPAEFGQQRKLRRPGIAESYIDALLEEELE